jgi:hypothetical protein
MSKKLLVLIALLFVGMFAFNGACFAWGTQGGDGSDYRQLQETAVFYNNSDVTTSAGTVFILDTAGTDVSAGTTLGSYVTLAGSTDNVLAVGVQSEAQASCSDGTPVILVTKGPVDTLALDSGYAVTINTAVGTEIATSGYCGGGTNLGIALEAGDGTDTGKVIVWVSPTGAD